MKILSKQTPLTQQDFNEQAHVKKLLARSPQPHLFMVAVP